MSNLTAAKVRNAGSGRYSDGNGLILVVWPSGSRNWIQRITVDGKRKDIGLGGYPAVKLAEAREAARRNKEAVRSGRGPESGQHRAEPTFEAAAVRVHGERAPGWRNPKHAAQWIATLREYAFPRFGAHRISTITTTDVLAALMPIWHEKPETARRVRQRISTVMLWAVAHGHRPDNPAGEVLGAVLPRKNGGGPRRHFKAVPYGDVGAALATIRETGALPATRLAIEFLVLTAARSGEVRLATWAEIDMDAATWTVPAQRMKAEREHRVPLSPAALAVLHQAAAGIEGTGATRRRNRADTAAALVFPAPRGGPLSDSTLSKLLRENDVAGVPHGFRSSFRDWAAECTYTPHRVMEAALAHTIANKAEAAYARSDLFEKRRELMDAWAAYLTEGA